MNARLFSMRSPGRDWFSYTGPGYRANTGAVRTAAQEKQPIGFSFEALLVFFSPPLLFFLKTLLNSVEFPKKKRRFFKPVNAVGALMLLLCRS